MKKPDSLRKLRVELDQYYGAMHTNQKTFKDMYNREYEGLMTDLPDNVPIHESSTTSQVVDALRDQLVLDLPKVEYLPLGDTKKDREHKALMEMFGKYLLGELAYHYTVDPFSQAAQDLIWLGAGCIKHLLIPERILARPPQSRKVREWEAEQARVWPFLIKPIDPMNVMVSPGMEVKYVLEVQERFASDVLSLFPAWSDPLHALAKPRKVTTWLEYWSEEHYMVEVDGEMVRDLPNIAKHVPYSWSYSGFGRADSTGDPQYLASSILSNIIGELEDEVRIKTAQSAQWQYHVFPRLLTTENAKEMRKKFMVGPGAVIEHVPGQEPKWLEVPPPNPQMMEFLEIIHVYIYRRGGAALTGRPEGVDYGIHQAMLIGQALKVLSPIRTSLNKLATNMLNSLINQMYLLEVPLNVRGHVEQQVVEKMVRPKDCKHQSYRVQFEAVDPAENDRRMIAGLAVLRGGPDEMLLADYTFRDKYLKGVVDDAEKEEAVILAELAVRRFVVSGAFDQLILADIAGQDREAQIQEGVAEVTSQLGEIAGAGRRQAEGLTGGSVSPSREVAEEGETEATGALR